MVFKFIQIQFSSLAHITKPSARTEPQTTAQFKTLNKSHWTWKSHVFNHVVTPHHNVPATISQHNQPTTIISQRDAKIIKQPASHTHTAHNLKKKKKKDWSKSSVRRADRGRKKRRENELHTRKIEMRREKFPSNVPSSTGKRRFKLNSFQMSRR